MGRAKFSGTERFELLRHVGSGGVGAVYEVFDRKRDARVALKVLEHVDATEIYRFKQEFRALADVAHPNLVTLHELLSAGDHWFLTMELVDGVDVVSYVDEAGDRAAAFDRLRDALQQLVAGLSALHDAGKVHRDVKPSNVLVTADGRVVLLDFGLVGELTRSTPDPEELALVIGTALYIAPEQIASSEVTAAADWYSVGVILYQALTGRPPFRGDPLQVLADKELHAPPPPSELVDDVPVDLDHLCARLLAVKPAARPSSREILELLGARATDHIEQPDPGLVGRERHLAALERALGRVRDGRGVSVFVRGASGMGKTALMRRFLAQVRERDDVVVIQGRCFERETVPFKAFDSIIDELTRYLLGSSPDELADVLPEHASAVARVFPVFRRVAGSAAASQDFEVPDPVELRARAIAALRQLLRRLAEKRPVVLHIDDLQWGDLDSVHVLAELTRQPSAPAILLLACVRTGDDSDRLAASLRDRLRGAVGGDVREIVVDALEPSESRELALSLMAGADVASEHVDAIAWESGGNPLFVQEFARYVLSGEAMRRPGGDGAASITLDEVLRARFESLPDRARNVLELVAVAGAPVQLRELRHAVGSGDELIATIASLRAGHLVHGRATQPSDLIEPSHDRIREAVIATLSPEVLADRHRQLARALEQAPRPDVEALARHWRYAGDGARSARYACEAAEKAASALAFDRAARLYEASLAGDHFSGRERHRLQVRHGDALANAGRGKRAGDAYLEAAATAPSKAEATELKRRAAEQLLRSGHLDRGVEVVREVLAALGTDLARSPRRALMSVVLQRARLRLRGLGFVARDAAEISQEDLTAVDAFWSAATGLGMVDIIHGVELQARGLLCALAVGERYRVCRALAGESITLATAGGRDKGRARAVLTRADELARELGSKHALGVVKMAEAYLAFLNGRWSDVVRHAKPAIGLFRNHCQGARWELTSTRHIMLWSLVNLGRLDELPRRVLPALREAEGRGDLYMATMLSTGLLNLAWLCTGQVDHARERLVFGRARWSLGGYHLQHYNQLLGDVHLELYCGARAAARDRLLDEWRGLDRSLLLRTQQVRIEAIDLRARTALASVEIADDPRPLLADARRLAKQLRGEHMPWSDGLAGIVEAALAFHGEGPEVAVDRLSEAATAFDALEMAAHAAVARRRRGELLGGDEGRALVEAADELLRELGIAEPERWAAMLAPGYDEA